MENDDGMKRGLTIMGSESENACMRWIVLLLH